MKNIFSKIKLAKVKDKFSFGLDIGSQAIKCVKLRLAADTVELVSFDLLESQLDPTEVLKKIKHEQGAETVNISFCGASTVIRYVNFVKMNKTELKAALKFEAQKHIPFSINEVNLDAEILKDDLPDNKMLVLIAALKKEAINQRIKLLEGAGLRPAVIDIDSLALVNAYGFANPQSENPSSAAANNPAAGAHKSICILNIGSAVTNVNILDNGIVRLSRDIHSAGANFTKKIMDAFELEFKAAEELKLNPPPDAAAKVRSCVESVLTGLATEIRTSFDYYESQTTASVSRIFLSGGTANIAGLKEMLTAFLGIPVEEWDPLSGVSIPENIDRKKLDKYRNQLHVALGLALR